MAKVWTHRIRRPDETLAALAPHLATFGITRIADITGLDRIGIPVAQAVRPLGRSLSVSQGKGETLAAAFASAAMEAVEGWHAEFVEAEFRRGTLTGIGAAFPLRRIAMRQPIPDDVPLTFIAGRELLSGDRIWLPVDLIHKDWTRPAEASAFRRSTAGLASGNDWAEALSHALHELIERHEIARFQRMGAEAKRARRVGAGRLAAIDPTIARLIGLCRGAGLHLTAYDATGRLGVPTLRVELMEVDRGNGGPVARRDVGLGCHLSPLTAAIRAITEAAQARLTRIAGSRDDLAAADYRPAAFGNADRLLGEAADMLGGDAAPFDWLDASGRSPDDDVAEIARRLARAGCDRIGVVDLSREDLPVRVIRAVVPGLDAFAIARPPSDCAMADG